MMKNDGFHTPELPEWLQLTQVRLAEDEDPDGGDPEGHEEPTGEEDDDLENDGNVDGLRSALQKERQARKAAEKAAKTEQAELAQLRQAQQEREDAEKTEIDRLKAANEALNEKLEGLSEGYVKSTLDSAIREAAKKANFRDPEDAIALVNRSEISFNQNTEDPAAVEVDQSSIEKAVKDLATRKPHYLGTSNDSDEPSGSGFGGDRRGKKKVDEDALKEKYPSLR